MKCGNCKEDHERVADVRACYEQTGRSTKEQRELPGEPGFRNSGDRHHDARRDKFEQINMLGDKLAGGYYALRNSANAENDVSFYKVDKPDVGKWAGKTFVKLLLGAPGAWREERLPLMRAMTVLTQIVADEQGAVTLYGQKTQTCALCGSPLSNQRSRERGIGPDCARNRGWTDLAK